MKLLSVNAGSSSLKFRVYEMPEEKLLMKGMFERIGLDGSSYNIRIGEEKIQKEVEIPDHKTAVDILLDELLKQNIVSNLNEIGIQVCYSRRHREPHADQAGHAARCE